MSEKQACCEEIVEVMRLADQISSLLAGQPMERVACAVTVILNVVAKKAPGAVPYATQFINHHVKNGMLDFNADLGGETLKEEDPGLN